MKQIKIYFSVIVLLFIVLTTILNILLFSAMIFNLILVELMLCFIFILFVFLINRLEELAMVDGWYKVPSSYFDLIDEPVNMSFQNKREIILDKESVKRRKDIEKNLTIID